MIFVDIESFIPENHLLRKIERMVSFDFIYELLAPYYPATGRPSVDPVSMYKMLLIRYLYPLFRITLLLGRRLIVIDQKPCIRGHIVLRQPYKTDGGKQPRLDRNQLEIRKIVGD